MSEFQKTLVSTLLSLEKQVSEFRTNMLKAQEETEQAFNATADAIRRQANKQAQEVDEALARFQTKVDAYREKAEGALQSWKTKDEQQRLLLIAQHAEDYAAAAIAFAAAASKAAETAVLEAKQAREAAERKEP